MGELFFFFLDFLVVFSSTAERAAAPRTGGW